jgi:hypothetical protein
MQETQCGKDVGGTNSREQALLTQALVLLMFSGAIRLTVAVTITIAQFNTNSHLLTCRLLVVVDTRKKEIQRHTSPADRGTQDAATGIGHVKT